VFFTDLVNNAQLFFLIFARVMALLMVAPLTSSEAVPNTAKIGLGFFATTAVYPWASRLGYVIPGNGLEYVLLVMGEAMIGVIIGFFLQIVYAGFQTAGQFFSIQVGFGASEVYDPLSQEELPLLGQFFNLIAMYVFLTSQGFQKIFLYGVYGSLQALRAQDLAFNSQFLSDYFIRALGQLFVQSLTLSLPIVGTLFLVSIATGLMAKAAPQMNLLNMGFPINLLITFLLLVFVIPQLMEAFAGMVDTSFSSLDGFFRGMSGIANKMVGENADPAAAVRAAFERTGGALDQAVGKLSFFGLQASQLGGAR
jgi:flagellar biosynthetic protein FliR